MTREDLGKLISIREGAKLIGIHWRTLQDWVRTGRVPGFRVGTKMLRVRERDVLAMVRPVRRGAAIA